MKEPKSRQELEAELEALQLRLEEAEETLRAIQHNEVDALLIDGPQGQQVFTLQGAEQPYRILMECMSEGALTIASDGMILYSNGHFSELIGETLNKIIGTSFYDLITPPNGQSLKEMLNSCGMLGCTGEFSLTTAHKKQIPVSVSARGIILGDLEGFCVVITDLTSQKEIQKRLEESRDLLEEQVTLRTAELTQARDELEIRVQQRTEDLKNAYTELMMETEQRQKMEEQIIRVQKLEALGTFAGGIAHDFNNILAGIIGFTEMVLEDTDPATPGHRRLELVLKGANRGRDLVRQILTFSRDIKQDRKVIALTQVVEEALKLLRPVIPSTIDMTVKCLTDHDQVFADAVQIHQILTNLCSNAAHAMREKGGILSITISECVFPEGKTAPFPDMAPGEYVEFKVADTGRGMEPEIVERIFDPFFTTKAQGEGTGLGLSVVHGIVENHKGYIKVSSTLDQGTTFQIYFPKANEQTAPGAEEATTMTGGEECILIVDDEDLLVELYKDRLMRLGYDVVATTSSLDALNIFRKEPDRFDVVITDQTMPSMTGVELSAQLLKTRSTIPIILCTGHSETISRETAKEIGIRGFLMKPMSKLELAKAVRDVLDVKKK